MASFTILALHTSQLRPDALVTFTRSIDALQMHRMSGRQCAGSSIRGSYSDPLTRQSPPILRSSCGLDSKSTSLTLRSGLPSRFPKGILMRCVDCSEIESVMLLEWPLL